MHTTSKFIESIRQATTLGQVQKILKGNENLWCQPLGLHKDNWMIVTTDDFYFLVLRADQFNSLANYLTVTNRDTWQEYQNGHRIQGHGYMQLREYLRRGSLDRQ